MKQEKLRSAEAIFDAIGMIDDRIIADAQAPYRAPRAKSKTFFKLLIAVSSVLIVLSLVLSTVLAASFATILPIFIFQDKESPSENSTTFEQILYDANENPSVEKLKAEDIDFFDGNAKLIWRTENETEYNVITIYSKTQVNQIKSALNETSNKISPQNADSIEYQVWIAYENGTVVSPYLESSAGNVGYAQLFEYSPEVEPNEDLVKVVEKIVLE